MSFTQLVLYEEEFKRINEVLTKLYSETNAKVIFLVDRNGQLIANTGETENLDLLDKDRLVKIRDILKYNIGKLVVKELTSYSVRIVDKRAYTQRQLDFVQSILEQKYGVQKLEE